MKVSSAAAVNATISDAKPDSPALSQLKAAIDGVIDVGQADDQADDRADESTSAATAVLENLDDDEDDDDDQDDDADDSSNIPSIANYNTVTMDPPNSAHTTIQLLVVKEVGDIGDGVWLYRPGFNVVRQYVDPNKGAFKESHFEISEAEEDTFETIGEALREAAVSARIWNNLNSNDSDKKAAAAGRYLQEWIDEFDPTTVTETIFDNGLEEPEREPSPVAIISDPAPAPISIPTIPAIIPAVPDVNPTASIDAEITACGERIVAHSVQLSELKAAIKTAKKSWETASDEQVELLQRKAEILLEKREQEKRAAETPAAPIPAIVATLPATPTTESTEDHAARMAEAFASAPASSSTTPTNNAWRSVRLDTLPGITPKIIEILAGNSIVTLGDFSDVPSRRGIEYTQLSHNGAKLTEARFQKVQDALAEYWKKNPAPAVDSTVSTSTTADIDDI